jgi:hypothetical protein
MNTLSNGIFLNSSLPVIERNSIIQGGEDGIEAINSAFSVIENTIRNQIRGMACGGVSSVIIKDNQITDCHTGINFWDSVRAQLRGNVIGNHIIDGVSIAGTAFPDLGTEADHGSNQVSDNGKYHINDNRTGPTAPISAIGNWWGQAPPDESQLQGLIDYTSWLESPPSDPVDPPSTETPVPRWDVNEDGIVDLFDLILVASHFGERTIPIAMSALDLSMSSSDQMLDLLGRLEGVDNPPHGMRMLIEFLRSYLNLSPPITETLVFANYPNPFNPETWIPYQLATDAEVQVMIYNISGTLVRRLGMGYQGAGYYVNREHAAYWNGRDENGERVSSGLYFYQLRAGDYSAVKRMVIVK